MSLTAILDRECPCCGQSWSPGRSRLDARRLCQELTASSGQQALILKALLDYFGEWVPRDEMVRMVYRGDGGPVTAAIVVAVNISRLRKRVAPFGLEIQGISRKGSRLVWATPSGEGAP